MDGGAKNRRDEENARFCRYRGERLISDGFRYSVSCLHQNNIEITVVLSRIAIMRVYRLDYAPISDQLNKPRKYAQIFDHELKSF